jgi:hypothetical protein
MDAVKCGVFTQGANLPEVDRASMVPKLSWVALWLGIRHSVGSIGWRGRLRHLPARGIPGLAGSRVIRSLVGESLERLRCAAPSKR